MRPAKLLAAACALLLSSLAAAAGAQSKVDAYSYHFDDDLMVGDTLSTTPPLLRVMPKRGRVMLLRPRASFVAEMLKSVEAM
jgi:hypothetical protein